MNSMLTVHIHIGDAIYIEDNKFTLIIYNVRGGQ